MKTISRTTFTTVKTEGGILPAGLLQRIAEGRDLEGLRPEDDYHLFPGERLNEAINRAWNRCLGAWRAFDAQRARLPESDRGTTLTRERWLLVLFQELGYGRLQYMGSLPADAADHGSRLTDHASRYPISHAWGHTPIHLVTFRQDLDRRGIEKRSPHSLLQEFLNRFDDHLWGFVSNGLRLRVLRDNVSLTRAAYVEFDLEAIMTGEHYADFVLLWLVCHQSRVEGPTPEQCWLERWSQAAAQQGVRALDALRGGVQEAIVALGQGFLAHRANAGLRESLQEGGLSGQDYYRQLLRLVYRLIFLFVAEDRDLLLLPDTPAEIQARYHAHYSLTRLRTMAETLRGGPHADLYRSLRLLFGLLREGYPPLGLPGLGSFLFSEKSTPDLDGAELDNGSLLETIRALAFTIERNVRRPVDYRNLGAEELGSVYESLLELHPQLNTDAGTFELSVAAGSERKTTGSYYTPSSLIRELLNSALEPVVEDRLERAGRDATAQEAALLDIKVVDPATGSGHFLIAAAHRLARHLARVRTGDEEPAPAELRAALRDVVRHCIHGVDINPMAVELCKVALWMETLDPGKPLSFLDRNIQCGNSLIGATPALLEQGIPDDAFKPITGDDKAYCQEWRKRNKEQRETQQMSLFAPDLQPWERLGNLAAGMLNLDTIAEDTIADVRRKQEMYEELVRSSDYRYGRLWADAWCAAFVWKKTKEFAYPITEEVFRRIERNPFDVVSWVVEEIERLREQYQFFHWHLAFPQVFRLPAREEAPENEAMGWSGGFDVVLGNPPWEMINLMEREFFAGRDPRIASARTGAMRKRLIQQLPVADPELHAEYEAALREAEGQAHYLQNSGRFPLTSGGRINTYAVFAGLVRQLLAPVGRAGIIVPPGIATDYTYRDFFADVVDKRQLASLYDFENKRGLFPAVAPVVRFCLLTLGQSGLYEADFAFFLQATNDLAEPDRHFSLTADDFALINPNTRTVAVFRTRRDAELTKTIYHAAPVLLNERNGENPWGVSFRQGLFNMTSDSGLFCTRRQLEASDFELIGNRYEKGGDVYSPLYEAKMVQQYDHRHGTFEGIPQSSLFKMKAPTNEPSLEQLGDPTFQILPRYWVAVEDVEHAIPVEWRHEWFIVFRNVIQPMTNARCALFTVVPRVGVGNSAPILMPDTEKPIPFLLGCLDSFVVDYVTRQSMGGSNLNFYIVKQLPVLPPPSDTSPRFRPTSEILQDWIAFRVLELTYTARDLQLFAQDCGYDGPPFRWDEERRFLLRCELDAAYFHLYSIARDDVDYIMETFPIVKRKDEAAHGEYRTKRVILEIYDAMQRAIETGEPYQTLLDPPPADPRVAHPPREYDGGN